MEEYIPFNVHFNTFSTMCQRLFQIFSEFNAKDVSYGGWLSRISQGPLGLSARGKPLSWTRANVQRSVDLDNSTFLAGLYAAFLSGWALPSSVSERIHPDVFIATTNLDDGIQMNLAVPSL